MHTSIRAYGLSEMLTAKYGHRFNKQHSQKDDLPFGKRLLNPACLTGNLALRENIPY